MPRKTNGSTAVRSKKTEVPVPAAVQATPEFQPEVGHDSPRNGKSANLQLVNPPANLPMNMEDEIRRRAYELYLQRRATAGAENGNQNQDWLIAENEIRSRYNKLARHTTA
ncbi:MAG: hypothetical protein WB566_15430 [Terriglobales bacterium]